MKTKLQILLVGISAVALIACGGGENGDDADTNSDGDETETIECGEGTLLDDELGECVAETPQCDDGEVHDALLGRCVPGGEHYCAEGTELNENIGQCTADADLACGGDTIEDDGYCIPETQLECGPGTVVYDEQCVVADDVCAGNTEHFEGDGPCVPIEGICGEGTLFDTSQRVCIPASDLECGPGTTAEDSVCRPTQSFFDDLAEDPDLDMTSGDATGTIEVPDEGERFSFVGNIDPPDTVDGQPVQDRDVYTLDAEAGQWLRITVFSLGLPEPGFAFGEPNEDGTIGDDPDLFHRFSDVGLGIETSRDIVVPADGSYELAVTNLPQMLGGISPAGGDDWNYVGFVETLEAPDAQSVDFLEESISGDIRDLHENLYHVDELGDIEVLQLIFNALPGDADVELQVWTDETTHHSSIAARDSSIALEPPADSFYLLFDRIISSGADTGYSVSAHVGEPLPAGESITETLQLNTGDYVGIFQFNSENQPLAASITDGGEVLAELDELVISTAEEGQTSLYWYAPSSTSVTVEVENTTGQDIDSISFTSMVGTADSMTITDDSLYESTYDQAMSRGQRHYFQLEMGYQELFAFTIDGTSSDGLVVLMDNLGEVLSEGLNTVVYQTETGAHILYVEAVESMGSGFTLTVEESELLEYSETSEPSITIPIVDNPPEQTDFDDTINIPNCPTVSEITVDLEIYHNWRGDLIITLGAPDGEAHVVKSPFGSEPDIIGNLNETLEPLNADPVSIFEGVNGTGEWTLSVTDTWSGEGGTFESWTLNLDCDA